MIIFVLWVKTLRIPALQKYEKNCIIALARENKVLK